MRRLILVAAFVVCGWAQVGWAQTCEQVKSSQPLDIQVEAMAGELRVTVTNVHRWRVWRIVGQWPTSMVTHRTQMKGYTAEGWQHTPVWWWDMNQLYYRDLAPGASAAVTVPIDEPATHFAADVIARSSGEHNISKVRCVPTPVPDLPATLTLSAAPAPTESGPDVTVTATLDNPAPANGTTVALTTGGTATLDTDYTLSATTITIAEGETEGTATISVIDDAEEDGGETIILDAESTNPALTAPPLTLTIEDNDAVPVPALPVGGALLLGVLLLWLGAARVRPREVCSCG